MSYILLMASVVLPITPLTTREKRASHSSVLLFINLLMFISPHHPYHRGYRGYCGGSSQTPLIHFLSIYHQDITIDILRILSLSITPGLRAVLSFIPEAPTNRVDWVLALRFFGRFFEKSQA